MNYLAHLFLAGDDEDLMVGNFIADDVKGKQYENYAEQVAKGILMHRETDHFCDHHPVFQRSMHRLPSELGKCSGIITDMFYDYFLANEWSRFSKIPLRQFCDDVYMILLENKALMPEQSKKFLEYMSKYDWLASYKEKEGIKQALKGISRRLKYYFPLENAVNELNTNKEPYRDDFLEFFPLLQQLTY
jgi:acyl carrier protein phosphodiesterase